MVCSYLFTLWFVYSCLLYGLYTFVYLWLDDNDDDDDDDNDDEDDDEGFGDDDDNQGGGDNDDYEDNIYI